MHKYCSTERDLLPGRGPGHGDADAGKAAQHQEGQHSVVAASGTAAASAPRDLMSWDDDLADAHSSVPPGAHTHTHSRAPRPAGHSCRLSSAKKCCLREQLTVQFLVWTTPIYRFMIDHSLIASRQLSPLGVQAWAGTLRKAKRRGLEHKRLLLMLQRWGRP